MTDANWIFMEYISKNQQNLKSTTLLNELQVTLELIGGSRDFCEQFCVCLSGNFEQRGL